MVEAAKKTHAVCIPLPGWAHIKEMFQLAKLLNVKGYHITFVLTVSYHKKLADSRGGGSDSLVVSPDFQFDIFPDGQDLPDTAWNSLDPCRDIIAKINNSTNIPPVCCIVSDFYMCRTFSLADELGIPHVFLWPCSAVSLLTYLQLQHISDEGVLPLEDKSYITNGYLDKPIEFIPGMKDIRLKDLPAPIWDGSTELHLLIHLYQYIYKTSAVVINTFDALESEVLEQIKSLLGLPLYTVGPLKLLEEQISNDQLRSFKFNPYKEDEDCFKWLDSKQPSSVVYVCFGSHDSLTQEQLVEFAWGLANSKQAFFMVMRPDLVFGESAMLPKEFTEEIADRGMISGWCPQEEVLRHSSIGGFVTHSGWNSTLETICGGVPVISYPIGSEEPTNCRYACVHWGIGVQLNKDVKRDEVERLVRELMHGEKSKQMKKRAMEWKNSAEESTRPGGSSSLNFDSLVRDMLLLTHKKLD